MQHSLGVGLAVALAGLALFAVTALASHSHPQYVLSVRIFALLLVWTGAFVCCYGARAGRDCLFPLLFLLLTIPIPVGVLDRVVAVLQRGSAEMAYLLFKLAGVPVFRGRECSNSRCVWSYHRGRRWSAAESAQVCLCSSAAWHGWLRHSSVRLGSGREFAPCSQSQS